MLFKENLKLFETVPEFMNFMNWENQPFVPEFIDENILREYRDAKTLACVAANIKPKHFLDIGTYYGQSVCIIGMNSPSTKITTVNISPEQAGHNHSGTGNWFTEILPKNKIGQMYRKFNIKNVNQVYANTMKWNPDYTDVDMAFIDACHEKKYVINDTIKALSCMKSGYIIWHDCNYDLIDVHPWIKESCEAISYLIENNYVSGPIYQVKESWCGVCKIGN